MIDIIGGTYFERCDEPYWLQLYGSGCRAAAALKHMSDAVTLWTYISPDRPAETLTALAATFNFSVKVELIPRTLSFHYAHGLAAPHIDPNPLQWRAPSIKVEASRILRFGMLEGDGIAEGEWVVYDPQSSVDPQPFSANGSKARHLAIVANVSEIRALVAHDQMDGSSDSESAETKIEVLARRILAQENAEVVVVKQGSIGCLVVTRKAEDFIPAYMTRRVWPIGSGDVFTASFSHGWMEERRAPVEAAQRAALATATYCESRVLPIPADLDAISASPTTHRSSKKIGEQPEVYLAGPFFTLAERWLHRQAFNALRDQGLRVFSPLYHVGLGSAAKVVPEDIAALNRCATVFAILDGLDAGTLFEIGYARALGIPVIVFAQKETDEHLKMAVGTDCQIEDDFATAIYLTAWTARER